MNIKLSIRITGLLLTGLYAGAAMYSIMGVGPSMELMNPTPYAEFHQKLDVFMGVRMAIFAKIALAVNIILLITAFRSTSKTIRLFTIVAFLFFGAELFFTLTVNVPLNETVQKWDINNLPADWSAIRAKWIHYDKIRAGCAIASFVVYHLAFLPLIRKNEK